MRFFMKNLNFPKKLRIFAQNINLNHSSFTKKHSPSSNRSTLINLFEKWKTPSRRLLPRIISIKRHEFFTFQIASNFITKIALIALLEWHWTAKFFTSKIWPTKIFSSLEKINFLSLKSRISVFVKIPLWGGDLSREKFSFQTFKIFRNFPQTRGNLWARKASFDY